MQIIKDIQEVKQTMAAFRSLGKRIVFVPTMGSLHAGHGALIDEARLHGDIVVVSVFVNPLQFGPQEDFQAYPRDCSRDAAFCEKKGVDILFVPEPETFYPSGFSTSVQETDVSRFLCGKIRPGHFQGVTTVLMRLFHIVDPHCGVFGKKDYQQLQVVRRILRDMAMDIEIVAVPTVREADGLALSSRNQYLPDDQRAAACLLYQALQKGKALIASDQRDVSSIGNVMQGVLAQSPLVEIEYLSVCDADSLEDVECIDGSVVIAIAARVGGVRLIDNIECNL